MEISHDDSRLENDQEESEDSDSDWETVSNTSDSHQDISHAEDNLEDFREVESGVAIGSPAEIASTCRKWRKVLYTNM